MKWVAFVGPSLSAREAKTYGCEVRGPARQGDVWRVLERRPKAIALIDGVFESQPSVWHHELRAALDGGVAVFGGASMGALRAAELGRFGMIGVGKIFQSYRDGTRIDDADVALLHADAEHAYRPLTVPQVNVEHAAALAVLAKVLTAKAAKALIRRSAALHYQDRTWRALDAPAWLQQHDLKADDARACLHATAEWVRSGAPALAPRATLASSHVRRRRLADAGTQAIARLTAARDVEALTAAGMRRVLLARWARAMGVTPDPRRVAHFAKGLPVQGIAADEAVALSEELALEEELLATPWKWLADGPSPIEGLASEAKLRGRWKP